MVWEADKPGESVFARLFALNKKQRAASRSVRLAFLLAIVKAFDTPETAQVGFSAAKNDVPDSRAFVVRRRSTWTTCSTWPR